MQQILSLHYYTGRAGNTQRLEASRNTTVDAGETCCPEGLKQLAPDLMVAFCGGWYAEVNLETGGAASEVLSRNQQFYDASMSGSAKM